MSFARIGVAVVCGASASWLGLAFGLSGFLVGFIGAVTVGVVIATF